MEQQLILDTPLGPLTLTATEQALTSIRFGGCKGDAAPGSPTGIPGPATQTASSPLLRQVATELQEYFAGRRRAFTVPLKPAGTPFQQAVWEALCTIPCGQTRTYKQIAAQIGRPTACRAVGIANNRNPLPILIPCHRVVGSDGRMVGYAGGVDLKMKLLKIEK